MIAYYLPDIGDGLAAAIKLLDGTDLQVDCGSQQYPKQAYRKSICRINPDIFILSHFHLDHYNGLLFYEKCRPFSHPNIKQVFFPKIPRKGETCKLLKCMFLMHIRVMGDLSGSQELDFLYILSRINKSPFTYRPVSQGDKLIIGGSQLEILWPPKEIDSSSLKVIEKAIEDFDKAKEEDDILKKIYEELNDRISIERYFENGEIKIQDTNYDDRDNNIVDVFDRDIPEVTKEANKSLRRAANHLSIAFKYDSNLLFLGDLESNQLNQVANRLINDGNTHYITIITPHHGTHWHNSLKNLSAIYALSSVGEKLFAKIKPEFKSISNICLYTFANGEIEIPHPVLQPLRFWRRRYWRFYI